jgi:hypothetical protein
MPARFVKASQAEFHASIVRYTDTDSPHESFSRQSKSNRRRLQGHP